MATQPINPAVLNALTFKWGRERADLDDQQNRYRINYNSALRKMSQNYDRSNLTQREGFADRGMLQAGPAVKSALQLRTDYNQQQADAALGQTTNLATIARKRLEGEQDYKSQLLLARLGLTTG
jgi:hypothetical protein